MAAYRDEKIAYVRWQGFRIAQLSLCISLFLGFSLAMLGFSASLLSQDHYDITNCYAKIIFLLSITFGLVSTFSGSTACLTRVCDFRKTAKVARERKNLAMEEDVARWRGDYKRLGWWTWTLFKTQVIAAGLQVLGLVIALGITYWYRLR
jgi:hypothetical protein